MKDRQMTKEQLLKELAALHRRVAELQAAEAKHERAEKEIAELERQIEFILGATKTGLDIIDAGFNIRYIDPEWKKVYGEPHGKKCYRYFMDRDSVCPGCGIVKALETKAVAVTEETLPKEGHRPIQVTTIPFQNREGEWLVAEVNVDITERKRAEDQTRIFQTIADSANAGVALAGLDGKIVYANEHFALMHGYSPKELIGRNISLCRTDQSQEALQEADRQLRELGGHGAIELWQRRKDGSVFPVLMNGVIVRDVQGQPLFVASIGIDVSKRKRAEDALRKSESKYRVLLENLPQKVFLKDRNSSYLSCNESYARELKIKTEEIVGKTDYDFYAKELAEKYRADDLRIMESGKTEDIEETYIQDGQAFIVHTVKTPVKDEEGHTFGILGIFWDVTESRRAQGELQRTRAELEVRVRERTAELTRANEALTAEVAERKRAEDRALLLNRLLHTLSDINQMIVRETNRDHLLAETCRILVEQGGFRMAWIGMADFPSGKVLPVAQAGVEKEFIERLNIRCDDTPGGRLPTGIAIRTGQRVICHGIERDETFSPWRAMAQRHKCRAAGAFPLRVRGRVVGAISVFAADADALGEEMTALLDELAADIAYALHHLGEIAVRKRAEEALWDSEQKYRTLVQQLPDGFCVHQNGRIVFSNEAHWRMMGFQSEREILGTDAFEFVAEESREMVRERIQRRLSGEEVPQRYEIKSRRRDGSVFDSEVVAAPTIFNGKPAIQVALRDISERKRAEERIGLLNRLLGTITEINQMMVREKDRDRLLGETCRILVEHGGFSMAWIGMADFKTGEVEPAAQAGFRGSYLEKARVRCDDSPRGRGPTGMAIRTGKHVICDDMETDPAMALWRESAKSQGYRSSAAFPLSVRGRVIGAVNVYAPAPQAIGQEMAALLEELTADVSFAMEALDESAQRQQAEQALRLTQFSMDRAADTVFWVAPDARILYANDAACRALGYSREELLSMTIHDIDQDFQADVWPRHWAELKQRGYFTFESRHRAKDGRIYPVEITINYLEFGGKEYNLAFVRDITERKKAEQALRLDESRLEALLTLSHMTEAPLQELTDFAMEEAVRLTGSTIGYLAYMNEDETILTMHSWSKNAMRQCAIIDRPIVYPIETTGLWGEAIRQRKPVITNDYTAPSPLKKGYPHGHVPVFRHMNLPVFDGDRIVAVAGVGNKEEDYNESDVRQLTLLMDGMWRIIQRRRAAEALRERNETLRAIIQGSPVAIITLDRAANITSWSAAAERILGWSAAEVIGGPSPIIPPEEQEEARRLRERMLQGESITDLEVRRQKKDGSLIDLSLSTAPMRDKEGNLSGYVYLLIDITQHKKMEEELFRTRKIESVGLLAGGIAHDFNNLLSVILGNISLARTRLASDDKPRIFEKLAEAEKACLRSRELTYQLLTFSRGGAPVKKTASIAELLKESAGFALRGSDVRCEFSLPDDLWPVEMDEGQIGQVISNLVINADQAMPKGGVVQVRAENVVVGARLSLPLPQGRYVKVTVEDHGIGIPKEHLQGIFDPYFTTKQKGSGLGLATAYSIIRRHDGYIALVSELGTGTKAMFYLPASQKKAPPKKDSMETPIAGHGRILVMDDEEMILEVVEAMLTQLGYQVALAKDGAEAIESYAKARQSGAPFDAAIIDLTVAGGMGGKEAIQKLLELDPHVKAIVSSGYSEDPIMSDFQQYGFSGVIAKPYRIEDMSAILHKVLRGEKV